MAVEMMAVALGGVGVVVGAAMTAGAWVFQRTRVRKARRELDEFVADPKRNRLAPYRTLEEARADIVRMAPTFLVHGDAFVSPYDDFSRAAVAHAARVAAAQPWMHPGRETPLPIMLLEGNPYVCLWHPRASEAVDKLREVGDDRLDKCLQVLMASFELVRVFPNGHRTESFVDPTKRPVPRARARA